MAVGKSASRLGFYLIIGLLLVGLAGFGATNISSGGRTTLAAVGEEEITMQQYANALNDRLRAFEQTIGQPVTMELARQLGLDQAVLQGLVIEAALDDEADEMGLSVGDAEVRERVLARPEFQGLDGQFDRDIYGQRLDSIGLTEGEFETQIRDDSARAILQAAVIGGVPRPEAYAATVAEWIGQRRSPTFVRITEGDLAEPPAPPTDEEIAAYWEENPDLFTTPEVRHISYAWLTPEMLAETIEIPEEDLRARYEERLAEFVQPERRLVERLVLSTQEVAEEARAALDAGETDFETLVSNRGLALSDVDLGDVAEDDLGAAGPDVFAAQPGEVVGPLETPVGPALFRVNAILSAQEIPFEEAAEDLRAEVANERAIRLIDSETDGLADLIAGGADLDDLVANSSLEAGQIDWTDGTSEGIAAYDEFRQAAAAAEQGAYPEIATLEDGGVFALRLDEVTEPQVRPLDEVRDEVAAALDEARTREAVLARAEEIATDIRESGAFRVPGRNPRTQLGIGRRDFLEGLPRDFVSAVFEMDRGEVRTVPTEDGVIVVRLDGISAADEGSETVAAERQQIAERTGQSIAQDIYGAFATAVQQDTDIRIDDAAVNAVLTQFQ
ncbi:peptidyl-prolyl cis-trans isomerase [Wenxinia marina]|uniref:Parvulin-like PPIase n=1 Tax=Wenxinia marina DSM 24838 TaxID=1123501 RepID=A0A0D0Q2Z0_9RHOB|nr:peptidyl-prolyl cis-trans isomerase [Wenxinia marina]KIQ68919.1 SurA N-terminal domain protein/PPIC-type PPIASE domain protein [Wenxinia marina DSM 24838]GGL64161.1 peptidyl-prolyl cis-trans isomerase [Wenxinia marina]